MGEMRNEYKILTGKSERSKPLGRRRHRWEDNIKMDHKEIGCEDMGWISSGSGYGQLVDCCEHGNEPPDSIKDGEFLVCLIDL
jgi:hypothetical protein